MLRKVKQLVKSKKKYSVKISIFAIKKGLTDVKLIQESKLPRKSFSDFKKEIENKK